MDVLPLDVIPIIFGFIKLITDKRQFLKTCVTYNNITKNIMEYTEDNFIVKNFDKINKYCVEKFTLELCHDKYFNMIPISYLNTNNTIIVESLVIFNKNIDLLQIAINNGCKFTNSVLTNDMNSKFNRSMLAHLFRKITNKVSNHDTCSLAAMYGHLEVLKFARAYDCNWNWKTCAMAAKNGHLDIIIWARENGCEWDYQTPEQAAKYGHLNIIMWAIENGCEINNCVSDMAVKYNHLNILIWLKEHNFEISTNICNIAAENGHLDILKWLINNEYKCNNLTCMLAASNGHLNVVKWLRENDYEWNILACIKAIEKGHLHVLKWCIENGCEMDVKLAMEKLVNEQINVVDVISLYNLNRQIFDNYFCNIAALNGHLHIIKYLKEIGYELDEYVCSFAAFNGHLNIIKWARENKCKWNDETYFNAKTNGHINIIDWLKDNNCPKEWYINEGKNLLDMLKEKELFEK